MIRALHVIDTLGRGGAEQLLVTLLPALREQGMEPVVAVLKPPYDLQADLEASGIQVIHLPAFWKWNMLAGRNALRTVCAELAIDIVHAHLFFPGLYAGLLSAGGEIPTFETFHNLAYAGANQDNIKLRLRKALRQRIAQRSGTKFLAVSDAVATHYSAALGLDRVVTLPNAVDLTEIEHIVTQNTRGEDDTNIITIAVPGRLVPEKGHADLLLALAVADLPPFTVQFIGGGPLQSDLEDHAAKISVPLTITGTLPHDRFLHTLAKADICVVPSRYEGFGIAAAEAMALAIPVVATNVGGLPEVVGNAGVIVPAGDKAALRDAIIALAKAPDRRSALGSAGADRVHEKFSHTHSAKILAAFYESEMRARTN